MVNRIMIDFISSIFTLPGKLEASICCVTKGSQSASGGDYDFALRCSRIAGSHVLYYMIKVYVLHMKASNSCKFSDNKI